MCTAYSNETFEWRMKIKKEYGDILSFMQSARKKKILVVGDILLDEYMYCCVNGVSSSIKIPVLTKQNTFLALGGAANIAANVSSFSDDVKIWGEIGNDSTGEIIIKLLREKNIKFIGEINKTETISKKRIYIDTEQVVRIDSPRKASRESHSNSISDDTLLESDVVIFADYGYGTISQSLLTRAKKKSRMLIFTSRDIRMFNTNDIPIIISNENELKCKMNPLSSRIDPKNIMHGERFFITRGASGISYQDRNDSIDSPALKCAINNVTGAGDFVCAIVAAFFENDISRPLLLQLANIAGAIAAEDVQTCTVDAESLIKRYFEEMVKIDADYKIINSEIARILKEKWRAEGYKTMISSWTCCDSLRLFVENCVRKKRHYGKLLIDMTSLTKNEKAKCKNEDPYRLVKFFDCIDGVIASETDETSSTHRGHSSTPTRKHKKRKMIN